MTEWVVRVGSAVAGACPLYPRWRPNRDILNWPFCATQPDSCAATSSLVLGDPEISLCDLRVPKNRCSKLEDVTDVLTEGGRLHPFSPRHVGYFAQSDLLNLVGEPQARRFIRCTYPVG